MTDTTTRSPRILETPDGLSELIVGTTQDDHIKVRLAPRAAKDMARLIAQGAAAIAANDPGDVDTSAWTHVVVDLLCSAALCGPLPEPAYASGYIQPKGNRP